MEQVEADIERLEAALQLFVRTIKRPQRWAAVTAEAGVTIDRPSAVILHTLLMQHPQHCGVQELAEQLGIEAPSVTRKTQELEQAGYLRRERHITDRRAIELRVTPSGRLMGRKLRKAQRAIFKRTLRNWPADDRQQFINLFERFSRDLALDEEALRR